MPPIQSVVCDPTGLVVKSRGQIAHQLKAADALAGSSTPAKAEAAMVSWLMAELSTDMNVAVHIFSLAPLTYTVWTSNLDIPVPANWW